MTRVYAYSVDEIEALLLGRLEQLACVLAPAGRRHGHEYQALNPARADHKLGSFSINLNSGKWADFAAGRGAKSLPCLALVAYLATGDDFSAAIRWAKDWLGLTERDPDPARTAQATADAIRRREQREAQDAEKTEWKRRTAAALWLSARPLDGTDPASLYLGARGIDVMALPGGPPAALRFNARLRFYEAHGQWIECPGLVAAMHREGAPNGFAACHQTYLEQTGGVWTKAFGRDAKRILGPKSGATIRLVKGASGVPLARAPADELVAIGEGVENCLSAAIAMPALRVLAAATLENIRAVALPAQAKKILIICDNDKPAPPGAAPGAYELLSDVCDVLLERGFDVDLARPDPGYKDFNDWLTGKRRAA